MIKKLGILWSLEGKLERFEEITFHQAPKSWPEDALRHTLWVFIADYRLQLQNVHCLAS